ncbi:MULTISPECIES: IclR family transcriptional regulator [Streptomyces]|uniref:IclR family transcriptional regulator n=1 Tax=Streptomyces lycopersici TaxID=2974589 RepID=UPI0021D2D258|nr:IclR family transcriptional regulator [Streptomyces sp. NEAU-383]
MPKPVNTSAPRREEPPAAATGPVDKALAVLDALVQPDAPHRLADLAARTGLPKPTVHRLLHTFAEAGYAVPGPGGNYQAGPRLLGLAATALAASRELRLARPVLDDLRLRTGHLAHFSVRDGTAAVHVTQSEPSSTYRMPLTAGGEVPLYCSAVGWAMLSALPSPAAAELLGGEPLPARTPRTMRDPGAVLAALPAVRERGYAVDDEYAEQDVRAIAAPVLGPGDRVAGAVGIVGLTFTLDEESVAVLGPMVRAAAGTVSAALRGGAGALGIVRGQE